MKTAFMTTEGLTLSEYRSTRGGKLTEVNYRGFSSYGFYRGSVRFHGDVEPTQVFSSAADDAQSEWERTKKHLALNLAVRRALCAEATLRDMATT